MIQDQEFFRKITNRLCVSITIEISGNTFKCYDSRDNSLLEFTNNSIIRRRKYHHYPDSIEAILLKKCVG